MREVPLKIIKDFSFHTKPVSVRKIFILLCWLFGVSKNVRLISKCMMSQPGKRTNAIHILPNLFRSKGNQTMKVGQLIENDTGNMFLEKSYTKCGGKTSPIFFSKISKLIISLNQWSKVLCSLFSLNIQVEGLRNILTQRCRPLAFTS